MNHTKDTKKIVENRYRTNYERGLALTRLLQDKYIRQYDNIEGVQEQAKATSDIMDLIRYLEALMERGNGFQV